jgi:Sec-independent protein secretion pathway component TatC
VDPVNMALVMAPLMGLYALGIVMASVVYRKRSPISETADE